MSFKHYLWILILLLTWGCRKVTPVNTVRIPAQYSFENQSGYVNDFDDILSLEEENALEKILTDYDNETTNEIGVVTVKSMEPFQDITHFHDALLEDWRFGKDDKFN